MRAKSLRAWHDGQGRIASEEEIKYFGPSVHSTSAGLGNPSDSEAWGHSHGR